MFGTNAQTGQALSSLSHLHQSIRDILTTRRGTRVMHAATLYGSRLPELVDNHHTQTGHGTLRSHCRGAAKMGALAAS